MSITASSLIALVEARGAKEATAQLLEVGAASDTAGEKIKSMAVGGLLVAGAAAIGFGVASVKMAGDFEQSTNLLITSAGEVPKNIDMIRKGLLQMSVDTATPVADLVKGMFNVESAGYHGAAALQVEKAAAQGAKVENADLATTTGILVTAMHDFHEPASQAVDVMNSFRMAASMGVMHLDDLNAALKNVLPIASQAGVSLTDVEAALSTMSLAGDKGASAGTHLSQMLTYLLAPSSKATGALKEVGLTTQQISDEMKVSLPDTIKMITDAVGEKFPVGSAKYIAALSAIVGGNKSMKAMLELSGISLKTFTDDANKLGPTMKANATAVDGWTTVQSNFNFKLDAAKNAVEALMISVGEKLLPVVGQLADDVTPLIQSFSDWVTAGGKVSDQLGVLQPAFQAVHDILPDISTFLTQAGDDINQYLLPPLGDLITNVGESISNFSTWLDKSGTAKSAVADLGSAVRITAQVLGTLVGWTSDLVGFLNQDTPAANIFKGAIVALGLAFVGLKLADTVSGFQQLVSKLSEGEGLVANLASSFKDKLGKSIDDLLSKQFPNLKKGFDDIRGKANDTAAAEEKVGTTAEGPMASGVEKGSASAETQLGNVEAQANASAGSVEGIGTAADTAEAQVATDTTLMDAELTGTKTAADGTSAGVAKVGDNASTATPQAAGLGNALWGIVGALMTIGLMEELNIWGNVIAGNYDNKVPGNYGAGGKGGKGFGGPHGYAAGTDNAAGGPSLVGERGAELVLGPMFGNLSPGSRVIPHDQTMSLLGGGNNQPVQHIHIEIGGHEVLSYLIDQMGNAMMQQSILQYGGRRW